MFPKLKNDKYVNRVAWKEERGGKGRKSCGKRYLGLNFKNNKKSKNKNGSHV
jgi:hypothetical protein